MGASYTAPLDQAAGPDGHRRPLTLAQADDALYQRLSAIIDHVRNARQALEERQIEDALNRIDEIDDELQKLVVDKGCVRITFPQNPASED